MERRVLGVSLPSTNHAIADLVSLGNLTAPRNNATAFSPSMRRLPFLIKRRNSVVDRH